MVKVSIEVHSGSTRFGVSVQAQGIQQAASIVSAWYPGSEVRVKFPIDPEGFFVEDSTSRLGEVLSPSTKDPIRKTTPLV